MNKEDVRRRLEESRAESNGRKIFVKMMVAALGANVVAPEQVAKPILDKVEGDDAWADLQIALSRVPEQAQGKYILAAAAKFLDHLSLLELQDSLQDLCTQIMMFCAENPEYLREVDADELSAMFTAGIE